MNALMVIGYVLAALLTLIPFVRLLSRSRASLQKIDAQIAERGHDGETFDDFNEEHGTGRRARLLKERGAVIGDLVLVGAGLVIATGLDIFQVLSAD